MAERFKVSQSKVKLWRRCRQAYHLKYVEKLKKRVTKRPFQFGRMVHEMIEAYANGDDPMEKLDEIAAKNHNLFRAELEQYGTIVEDTRVIMTEYFEYWGEDLKYIRRDGRSAEHKFEIDIGDGIVFTGVIDALGRAKKLRWLVEHKTFSRMPQEDHRWRNVQSAVYVRAIDIMGWKPVDGTLWDYVRSKPPSRPAILKSGAMSKAKCDTLPSLVKAVIEENKLDPDDYADFLKLTEDNRSSYFARVFTPTSRSIVELVWSDFQDTAREMQKLHGKASSRNIDLHCDYCDYEPICRATLQGLDVDWVKEKEYKKDGDETEDPIEVG